MRKLSTAGPGETRITTMIGRAIEDLPDDSSILKVTIINLLPGQEGGVASAESEAQTRSVTDLGITTSSSSTMANYIEAIYYGATNEKYPPSIRKGEQVEILQFGDSDRFYWRGMGRTPDLRTVDVRRIEVAAKPQTQANLGDDNVYQVTLDSKQGFVQIKTSMANEEKARYVLKFDGKKGEVTLSDHTQNVIYMNTERKEVMLSTASGATLRAIDKDVVIAAPRDVTITAGRNYTRKIGEKVEDEIGTSVDTKIGTWVKTDIGESLTEEIGHGVRTKIGQGEIVSARNGFRFSGGVDVLRVP